MGFVIGPSPEPVNSVGGNFVSFGLSGQKEADKFAHGGKGREGEAVNEIRIRDTGSKCIYERKS